MTDHAEPEADDRGKLLQLAELYLSMNDFEPYLIKQMVDTHGDTPQAVAFRNGLRAEINDPQIALLDWEAATGQEFDTREEYVEWLESLWVYFYDGGPQP